MDKGRLIMEQGLVIYFGSLAVLALFFLAGITLSYFNKNKESTKRGVMIVSFNLLFVLTVMCIGVSGAYLSFSGNGSLQPVVDPIKQTRDLGLEKPTPSLK